MVVCFTWQVLSHSGYILLSVGTSHYQWVHHIDSGYIILLAGPSCYQWVHHIISAPVHHKLLSVGHILLVGPSYYQWVLVHQIGGSIILWVGLSYRWVHHDYHIIFWWVHHIIGGFILSVGVSEKAMSFEITLRSNWTRPLVTPKLCALIHLSTEQLKISAPYQYKIKLPSTIFSPFTGYTQYWL